jgi:hypothetical protein
MSVFPFFSKFNAINNESNLYFFEKRHFQPTENIKLNGEVAIIRDAKILGRAKLNKRKFY